MPYAKTSSSLAWVVGLLWFFGRAKGDGNKKDRAGRDLTAAYFDEREGPTFDLIAKPSILAQHLIDSATKIHFALANKSRLGWFIHNLGGGHGWHDEIVGTVHSKGILATTHPLKVCRLLRRQSNQTSLRSVKVTTASTRFCCTARPCCCCCCQVLNDPSNRHEI